MVWFQYLDFKYYSMSTIIFTNMWHIFMFLLPISIKSGVFLRRCFSGWLKCDPNMPPAGSFSFSICNLFSVSTQSRNTNTHQIKLNTKNHCSHITVLSIGSIWVTFLKEEVKKFARWCNCWHAILIHTHLGTSFFKTTPLYNTFLLIGADNRNRLHYPMSNIFQNLLIHALFVRFPLFFSG